MDFGGDVNANFGAVAANGGDIFVLHHFHKEAIYHIKPVRRGNLPGPVLPRVLYLNATHH